MRLAVFYGISIGIAFAIGLGVLQARWLGPDSGIADAISPAVTSDRSSLQLWAKQPQNDRPAVDRSAEAITLSLYDRCQLLGRRVSPWRCDSSASQPPWTAAGFRLAMPSRRFGMGQSRIAALVDQSPWMQTSQRAAFDRGIPWAVGAIGPRWPGGRSSDSVHDG
jgi:hypothetical protein